MDRTVRTGILVIGILVVAAALVAGLGMDWLFPKPKPVAPPPAPEPAVVWLPVRQERQNRASDRRNLLPGDRE